MTPEELWNDLALVGITSRIRGDEVRIEVCRFCGNDRWNWELNPVKGVHHCWNCGARGRLDALLGPLTGRTPGEIPVNLGKRSRKGAANEYATPAKQKPIGEIPSAAAYLSRRGIDLQTAQQYGLAVCVEEGHPFFSRLLIPILDYWTGETLGAIARTYSGQKPKYLSSLPERQITGWRVRDQRAPTLLVEGQFDGIAVHRAGFHAAVLSGTGAEALEWFMDRLPLQTRPVFLLDGSAREQAARLYHRARGVRPDAEMIYLPEHTDPADFSPDVLRELISIKVSRNP